MISEKDFQLLDGYLLDQLNETEKAEFEQRLTSDPELKQEYLFQKEVIQGIRTNRIQELKTLLNNVPVGTAPGIGSTFSIKLLAGVLVTGAIATGIYFYMKEDKSGNSSDQTNTSQSNIPPASISDSVSDNQSIEDVEEPQNIQTPQPSVLEKSRKEIVKSNEEISESTRLKEQEALKIVSSTFVTSSREVITDNSQAAHKFHYSFRNGKLILYGSFDTNQYQILEFITANNHIYFLQYKMDYYLLDASASAPTPLAPIQDKQLIEKMRELRKK